MSINTPDARRLGHADHPSNPERRIRANFARQATIDAFGWRFAKALDQSEFTDRLPGVAPAQAPGAWVR